ncbi:MAG TPA: MauE/DoxX family redox-associated membrane protein [Candidatus Acidoferrales bacterium]|nr:MauE/DoxX family redox-associated membrane protein [Candidatus Acidoferrales bacterium]
MNTLESALQLVIDHGYQVLLLGLIVVLCVRKPDTRRKIVRVLLILGGLIVGAVFLAAAYGKMKPLQGFGWSWASVRTSLFWFAIQVNSYEILPPAAVNAVAHFLPYFELFLGLWLISGIARRFSALLASLAICGFMVAITSAYLRHLKIDCGCGIGPPEEVGPAALLRDGLKFLLPALLVTIGAFWIRRQSGAGDSGAAETVPSASATQ